MGCLPINIWNNNPIFSVTTNQNIHIHRHLVMMDPNISKHPPATEKKAGRAAKTSSATCGAAELVAFGGDKAHMRSSKYKL